MAFTASQTVILAEILQEIAETAVNDRASSLNFSVEKEAWIIEDIDLWESERNNLDVELEGGSSGVSFKTKWLLADIRMRVRNAFGLSLINVEDPRFESLSIFELEVGSNF